MRGQQQILCRLSIDALRIRENSFHLVEDDAFDENWRRRIVEAFVLQTPSFLEGGGEEEEEEEEEVKIKVRYERTNVAYTSYMK